MLDRASRARSVRSTPRTQACRPRMFGPNSALSQPGVCCTETLPLLARQARAAHAGHRRQGQAHRIWVRLWPWPCRGQYAGNARLARLCSCSAARRNEWCRSWAEERILKGPLRGYSPPTPLHQRPFREFRNGLLVTPGRTALTIPLSAAPQGAASTRSFISATVRASSPHKRVCPTRFS